MSQKLFYTSSKSIVDFITANPIKWMSRDKANGVGNQLETPTPVFEIFYRLLLWRLRLFTQQEFFSDAIRTKLWSGWYQSLDIEHQHGLMHRMYRNFYPAAIDQLHAFALLVESKLFKSCLLCPIRDAVGKVDIQLTTCDEKVIKVALAFEGNYCRQWEQHKTLHRGQKPEDLHQIYIPESREREPGNKRWLNIGDFELVLEKAKESHPPRDMVTEQLILL